MVATDLIRCNKRLKEAGQSPLKYGATYQDARAAIRAIPKTAKPTAAKKKKKRFRIRHPIDRFYQSRAWRELRYQILQLMDGRCQACGYGMREGVLLNVDHIKNRRDHPELELDPTNLQVLCSWCNQGKGNRDSTDWRDPLMAEFVARMRDEAA